MFATDDPTDELSAAWGIKEQLRRLLTVNTLEQAHTEKMILGCYLMAADTEGDVAAPGPLSMPGGRPSRC